MKIKVYFYNMRKGENRSIVFNIEDYNEIDKYIDNWIDEQIKSKLSDDFFDDCFRSDIRYSWFLSWFVYTGVDISENLLYNRIINFSGG